jgi:membrane-bound serine protease (ClpP class)
MDYFEKSYLPNDPNTYDLVNKKIVCPEGELLTLTANKAKEYGIAGAIVNDLEEALEYLEQQDGVRISKNVSRMETYWSEEMVRFLNSPAVSSLLVLGILLGIYMEFQAPGLGFPALLAVTCLVILVGSKYLMGLANWIEIAVVIVGIILLLVEIFVIPGFGVAGLSGILCIIGGLLAMWIKNAPDEFPWPKGEVAWEIFINGLMSISLGFILFVVTASLIAFNIERLPFLKRFVLKAATGKRSGKDISPKSTASPIERLKLDQIGIALGPLRPAGKVKFDNEVADVVSDGEFIEKGQAVKIVDIHGNRIVVTTFSETS